MSRTLRATLIALGVSVCMTVGFSIWQCSFLGTDPSGLTRGISNAGFAVAVIFLSLGLLSLLSRQGAFDGMRYLGYTLRSKLFRRDDPDRVLMSFFDFVNKEKKREKLTVWFLLIPGFVNLAVSVVATLLFNQVA